MYFTFCDHSDRAQKNAVKSTDRRGRAVLRFKFTQALSVIKFIGNELGASRQIQKL